jgi:hypothetical protein
MDIDKDALLRLASHGAALKFKMKIGEHVYDVSSFELSRVEIPVNKPTTRGGVYFSDKMGFKVKAQVSGDLSGMLSRTMLGPNADFEKIEFLTTMEQNGLKKNLKIFANLTNYVQRISGLELNLMVIGTESSQ